MKKMPKTKSIKQNDAKVHNKHIHEIKELEGKPNSDEALRILQRLSRHTSGIMKSHGLAVTRLAEFYPTDAKLLGININRGAEIRLRLRPHTNQSQFLPFEHILGTLMHELAHNKIGPHQQPFYNYMDCLQDEYNQSIASGFTPDGTVLGGQKRDASAAKRVAAENAERRMWLNSIMPAGGCTLGGQPETYRMEKKLSAGQMAAIAAERRAKDATSCLTSESVESWVKKRKEVIDLSLDSSQSRSKKRKEVIVLD